MVQTKVLCTIISCIGICLFLLAAVESAPTISRHYNQYYNNEIDEATPEEVLMELIARFGQTILRARDDLENSKRTVMDFGMARGYSGMQEAKHRMGIAAANFPGGPGRRRRSLTQA